MVSRVIEGRHSAQGAVRGLLQGFKFGSGLNEFDARRAERGEDREFRRERFGALLEERDARREERKQFRSDNLELRKQTVALGRFQASMGMLSNKDLPKAMKLQIWNDVIVPASGQLFGGSDLGDGEGVSSIGRLDEWPDALTKMTKRMKSILDNKELQAEPKAMIRALQELQVEAGNSLDLGPMIKAARERQKVISNQKTISALELLKSGDESPQAVAEFMDIKKNYPGAFLAAGKLFQAEKKAAGKPPPIVALQNARDDLPKGDPRRGEIQAAINRKGAPISKFMGLDDNGNPVFAEGAAATALTLRSTTKRQEERKLGEMLSLEIKELQQNLRPADVGIRGWLGEIRNTLAAQFVPALNDRTLNKNRALMRSIREKGMRLMTTDNRFNKDDRAAVQLIFPSDGIFESEPSAQDKMSMLFQIIGDRTALSAGRLKDRKPITEMTPNEIGAAVKSGALDKRTGLRALRLLHGFE